MFSLTHTPRSHLLRTACSTAIIIGCTLHWLLLLSALPAAPTQVHAQPPSADSQLTVVLVLHTPALLAAADAHPTPQIARAHLANIAHEQQRAHQRLAALSAHAEPLFHLQRAYNGIAVRVPPEALVGLANAPWVQAILPLRPKYLAHRTSMALIGAPAAWAAAPDGLTGAGVRIGIVDTGVDYTHATFGGTAAPPHFGPGAKVAGGYDFAGDTYNGFNQPRPDNDPRDCHGHGTHVAATAAGYGVTTAGTTYRGPYTAAALADLALGPGVAPEASIYALRVFGCGAFGTLLTDQAIEWALDPNGDGDLTDRLDILNLSLGIDFASPNDSTALAAQRATAAGMIVVAAATNSGDSSFAVGSPALADGVIAVAGSTDAGTRTDGFRVDAPAAFAGVYPGNAAPFAWPSGSSADVQAALVSAPLPNNGCAPFTPPQAMALHGAIVLLDWSGGCSVQTRVQHAADAGAVGVLISDPSPVLSLRPTSGVPIPTLVIPQQTGTALRTLITDTPVQITLGAAYIGNVVLIEPAREDMIYPNSARGPRRGDGVLKPDLTAPALTISSAAVGTSSGQQQLSGTSMAAPHVAGAAALLRQHHPDWSAAAIKALLMNSASADIFTGFNRTGASYGLARVGAGRLDLAAALRTTTIAFSATHPDRVSVSFGHVTAITGTTTLRHQAVQIYNDAAQTQHYTLDLLPRPSFPGVHYTVEPTNLQIGPHSSAQVTVTLSAEPRTMPLVHCDPTLDEQQAQGSRTCLNDAGALLHIRPAQGQAIHLPIHAIPRLAAATSVDPVLPLPANSGTSLLNLHGNGIQRPDGQSLVAILELQYQQPRNPALPASANIHALGIQSSIDPDNPDASLLSFGIATHGDWSATGRPIDTWFEVWIDLDQSGILADGSGAELILVNTSGSAGNEDVRLVELRDVRLGRSSSSGALNLFAPHEADTAPFQSRVALLSMPLSALGSTPPTSIRYRVASFRDDSFGSIQYLPVEVSPEFRWQPFQPTIQLPNAIRGPIHADQPGSIPVQIDQQARFANHSQGLLLLHFHHAAAARTSIVRFTPDGGTFTFLPFVR
jgi:subtilisin family serine protease